MIRVIKFLVGIVIVLAIIGGAFDFKSTDKDYSLILDKEAAKVSVYNGVVKIYNFVKELVDNKDLVDGNSDSAVDDNTLNNTSTDNNALIDNEDSIDNSTNTP